MWSRRKGMVRGLALLALALALTAPAGCAAKAPAAPPAARDAAGALPTVGEVLARYVEALGGREAIEKLETRILGGRMVTDLPSREPPVLEEDSLTIVGTADGRYRLRGQGPHWPHGEGWDGRAGWRQDQRGLRRDDDVRTWTDAWLANPQGPLQMREYFPDLRVAGREWRGADAVIVVETSRARRRLVFDEGTGLLVALSHHSELADYREVDGVLVPHRVVHGRKGGSSTLVVETITHNAPVDSALFAMPAED
ncbi:MAG: hypothetical protein JW819_12730 [Candidatus Krumholzibacteriota bacterium]|nr:hypothetical protein [Candidatus Krumholzibacteriota bacterium]